MASIKSDRYMAIDMAIDNLQIVTSKILQFFLNIQD